MPRNKPNAARMKEAQRLKKLRALLELTQIDLAKELRVAQGAIAHWESGNRTIPGPVLKLIDIFEAGIIKPGQIK